jgi:hypothetical protein
LGAGRDGPIHPPHRRVWYFGFVEMQEGGDKAIAQFSGKEFNSRALILNEARPMASRDSGAGFKRY